MKKPDVNCIFLFQTFWDLNSITLDSGGFWSTEVIDGQHIFSIVCMGSYRLSTYKEYKLLN